MIKFIHLGLFFVLIGLLINEIFGIDFIDFNTTDEHVWEKLILLQASIIWLYEYKFNLPLVFGPAVYNISQDKIRKLVAVIAIILFIGGVVSLVIKYP